MTDTLIQPGNEKDQVVNRNLAIGIGVSVFGTGVLFYILFFAAMFLRPDLIFKLIPMPTITNTVLSDGNQVYLLQERFDMSTVKPKEKSSPPPVKHFLTPLNGAETGTGQEIPAYEHASGNGGRLLFVENGGYRLYDGNRWREERSAAIGTDPIGLLAPTGVYVLSHHDPDPRLTVFVDGTSADLSLPPEYLAWYRNEQCRCSCERLVRYQGRLCLFWKENDTLCWALYADGTWSPASAWPFSGGYDVLADDQAIYLFGREGDGAERRLTQLVFRDGAWSEPVTLPIEGPFSNWDVFLQQGEPRLLTQHPTSATLATVANGRLVDPVRLKSPFDVAGTMTWWMILWSVGGNLLAGLAIVGISAVMVRFKKRLWRENDVVYEFATLSRRFVAFLIDELLLMIPPGIVVAFSLRALNEPPTDPFAIILPLFAALFLFFVGGFLYRSLLEGLWGQTLGKKLCGIRVLKADFSPCGLSAGFLRNLLRIVDAFFGYLVGVVAMAANLKWQRVGDDVARTVVVKVRRPPIPGTPYLIQQS